MAFFLMETLQWPMILRNIRRSSALMYPRSRRLLGHLSAGHPSHFSVNDALAWIDRFKPRRAVITNMHSDLDYEVLRKSLPQGVIPAYDGMRLTLDTPAPSW